jgi:hypothetical protein
VREGVRGRDREIEIKTRIVTGKRGREKKKDANYRPESDLAS